MGPYQKVIKQFDASRRLGIRACAEIRDGVRCIAAPTNLGRTGANGCVLFCCDYFYPAVALYLEPCITDALISGESLLSNNYNLSLNRKAQREL